MEAAEIELGPMSSVEIEKMVRELTEPGAIDIRDSESTVSARDYLIRTRQAPDIEVEEVEEGWTTPARESGGEEEEAEGSGTDSVDDSQLNEPFSCEDLVSRVVKSDFTTFVRFLGSEPTLIADPVCRIFVDLDKVCYSVFRDLLLTRSFVVIADVPARPTLNAHKKGVAEILGSLPVQDRDWRLLCTTAKLREHKLIPENASLQREPVYKEPSERQQERIDKRLSKQTPRETSDMTFLKSAPVLKIKQKGGTPASSPVVAQKRKSDVMTSLAADSSKKLAKTTQDKGKKVVIDSPVRPRDFLAMQEKLLAEIPYEELVSRSTELAAQSVALFMKAVATPSKETDSLKRQNAHFQENIKRLKQEVAKMEELHKELEEANRAKEQLELELKKSQDTIAEMARDLEAERESGKKQYDQAVSDYIYTTLSKVPDFDFSLLGDEAAEMAEAFRSMSPTRTHGNLPDEIEGAQAEEVENEVVSKIVDEAAPDETTPAA
ncbi:uncharacterized protein LOC133034697 [Cannabis sativa]|uniref:uncharacterized protein LOC133034697 n=1 Tax=Cannabis sativa TaxID=3483 RepID=UPI0029CA2F28|nr:uncharacterized protein LOC133034697 [Cannabis sativa]